MTPSPISSSGAGDPQSASGGSADLPISVVGLTGGIASGKSAVASFMREAGLPVLDADALGHMVLEPEGAAYGAVVERFGRRVLAEDGRTIDRQKLGGEVFDDPELRAQLERITHPAISDLARRGMEMIAERGKRLAIYEAALLVETGAHEGLAALVVVHCSLATQVERLCARDGISREAAAVRIASQLPLEEKLAVADFTVDNEGTLEETRVRTLELVAELERRFAPEEP